MNFSIIGDHRNFFRIHRWIECEEVLSLAQVTAIVQAIPEIQSLRINGPVARKTPNELFLYGRDLWRDSPLLKKHLQKGCAEIAKGLVEQDPIRLGYDQLFPALTASFISDTPYSKIIDSTYTLEEISPIQGLLCGAMICLVAPLSVVKEDEKEEIPPVIEDPSTPTPPKPINIFSATAGSAIFFAPDMPIDFSSLKRHFGGIYLLITFSKPNGVYFRQENDPLVHELRKLGYNFNDRLKETTHPLL